MKFQVPRHLGLQQVKPLESERWECHFGFSPDSRKLLELDSDALELLKFCFSPRSIEEISQQFSISADTIQSAVEAFVEAGVLAQFKESASDLERYDRHILYYEQNNLGGIDAQNRIRNSVVSLIGMGGIGNWVALNLIGAGFKEIRLIDFDTVELTNLTRQVLFDEDSIGKSKVHEAARVLVPKNSQTKLIAIDAKVDESKDIGVWIDGSDFVVVSADRPKMIHTWVDAACVEKKIPYINIGYKDGLGVIGPLTVPGKTSCYQCFKTNLHEAGLTKTAIMSREAQMIESWDLRYQAPSFGPLNAIVSSMGALEVIKYICGADQYLSMDVELAINPLTLEISRTRYRQDPNCWHCQGSD